MSQNIQIPSYSKNAIVQQSRFVVVSMISEVAGLRCLSPFGIDALD